MVKANVDGTHDVQDRLTAPQAPDDVVVNVFVSYQAKHRLVPSAPCGPTVLRATPPALAAWPRSPAAASRPLVGGCGGNRPSLSGAGGNKRSPRRRPPS